MGNFLGGSSTDKRDQSQDNSTSEDWQDDHSVGYAGGDSINEGLILSNLQSESINVMDGSEEALLFAGDVAAASRDVSETALDSMAGTTFDALGRMGDALFDALGFGTDALDTVNDATADALAFGGDIVADSMAFSADALAAMEATNADALAAVEAANYDALSFGSNVLDSMTYTQDQAIGAIADTTADAFAYYDSIASESMGQSFGLVDRVTGDAFNILADVNDRMSSAHISNLDRVAEATDRAMTFAESSTRSDAVQMNETLIKWGAGALALAAIAFAVGR